MTQSGSVGTTIFKHLNEQGQVNWRDSNETIRQSQRSDGWLLLYQNKNNALRHVWRSLKAFLGFPSSKNEVKAEKQAAADTVVQQLKRGLGPVLAEKVLEPLKLDGAQVTGHDLHAIKGEIDRLRAASHTEAFNAIKDYRKLKYDADMPTPKTLGLSDDQQADRLRSQIKTFIQAHVLRQDYLPDAITEDIMTAAGSGDPVMGGVDPEGYGFLENLDRMDLDELRDFRDQQLQEVEKFAQGKVSSSLDINQRRARLADIEQQQPSLRQAFDELDHQISQKTQDRRNLRDQINQESLAGGDVAEKSKRLMQMNMEVQGLMNRQDQIASQLVQPFNPEEPASPYNVGVALVHLAGIDWSDQDNGPLLYGPPRAPVDDGLDAQAAGIGDLIDHPTDVDAASTLRGFAAWQDAEDRGRTIRGSFTNHFSRATLRMHGVPGRYTRKLIELGRRDDPERNDAQAFNAALVSALRRAGLGAELIGPATDARDDDGMSASRGRADSGAWREVADHLGIPESDDHVGDDHVNVDDVSDYDQSDDEEPVTEPENEPVDLYARFHAEREPKQVVPVGQLSDDESDVDEAAGLDDATFAANYLQVAAFLKQLEANQVKGDT